MLVENMQNLDYYLDDEISGMINMPDGAKLSTLINSPIFMMILIGKVVRNLAFIHKILIL